MAGHLNNQGAISGWAGSMTAELHAMQVALEQLKLNLPKDNKKFLIVTDSMSGLLALKHLDRPDNQKCICDIHKMLESLQFEWGVTGSFLWVPSHIGIEGNEAADKGAELAMSRLDLEIEEVPATLSVIKSNIKKHVNEEWKRQATTSEFYSWVNPDKKPVKLPKAHRWVTSRILALRNQAMNRCPWRCKNICSYCGLGFSTEHYLLSCPISSRHASSLRDVLTEEEHGFVDQVQAAIILKKLNNVACEGLVSVIEECPPSAHCPDHPQATKFIHLRFMPL